MSWKERMRQSISRMDMEIPKRLHKMGIRNFEMQKSIPVYTTIADLYFPKQKLAVYFDGEDVHKSRHRIERDQMLRDALKQRGYRVLELRYKKFSEKTVKKFIDEILWALGMIE